MPTPDSTLSPLSAIRTKVRRLTRSPSIVQLSDSDIDTYVNTFVLYDFPEHLRLFTLRTTLTFYTEPFIDTYGQQLTDPTAPLYNFNNMYQSIHDPVYIAGYQSLFTQSRSQFYAIYPIVSSIASIGTAGNGSTTAFSGILANIPVLRNNVTFSSVNTANAGLLLTDDGTGLLNGTGTGSINYVTGAYTLVFNTPPAQGVTINSQTVPYVPSLPQALLYYDNQFIVRPVPDQPYPITVEAYVRPTELLLATDQPKIAQWWQYIAYGAAKKVFEDRMDMDSVQMIMPEFMTQRTLVLRDTIVQYTNERAATIYTEQSTGAGGNGWGFGGGLY